MQNHDWLETKRWLEECTAAEFLTCTSGQELAGKLTPTITRSEGVNPIIIAQAEGSWRGEVTAMRLHGCGSLIHFVDGPCY